MKEGYDDGSLKVLNDSHRLYIFALFSATKLYSSVEVH